MSISNETGRGRERSRWTPIIATPAPKLADVALPDRGDHVTGSLTDRAYDLLDELQKIAKELSSTVAAVSLAWVHSRPGVTSTIVGARSMKQLDSNLAALDLPLSTDHINLLDKLSEPKLNFPAQYLKIAPNFSNAGATVNGIESTRLPQAPKDLEDHY